MELEKIEDAERGENECPNCGDPTHFEEWPGKDGKMCSECGYEEVQDCDE